MPIRFCPRQGLVDRSLSGVRSHAWQLFRGSQMALGQRSCSPLPILTEPLTRNPGLPLRCVIATNKWTESIQAYTQYPLPYTLNPKS